MYNAQHHAVMIFTVILFSFSLGHALPEGSGGITKHRQIQMKSLFAAIDAGNAQKVRDLLKYGADPNAWGNHGERPLMRAITRGDKKIFDLLIQAGADVRAPTFFGIRPLHLAASHDELEIAQLLLKKVPEQMQSIRLAQPLCILRQAKVRLRLHYFSYSMEPQSMPEIREV